MQIIFKNFKDIEVETQNFIEKKKDKEFLWKETLEENF
jgi:hypothetical protein